MTMLYNLFHRRADSNTNLTEKDIFDKWKEYLSTIPGKRKIISMLPYSYGERKALISSFQGLLDIEMIDVKKIEKDDKEIISDIIAWKHEERIRRVKRLDDYLAFVETKHEYMDELLRHLYACLTLERELLVGLSSVKDVREYRKASETLAKEFVVEEQIIAQLTSVKDFRKFLAAVVRSEKIIHRLDKTEKRMAEKMKKTMNDVFANKIRDGVTAGWANAVYNSVQDFFEEAIASGEENPDFDSMLVNSPKFVEIVREQMKAAREFFAEDRKIKARDVSEEMINAFVHIFREWYNHERREVIVN